MNRDVRDHVFDVALRSDRGSEAERAGWDLTCANVILKILSDHPVFTGAWA